MKNEIRIAQGDTVKKEIRVDGVEFDEADKALVVIRDDGGNVLWWNLLSFHQHEAGYVVEINIPHADSIRLFSPSETNYFWGLTWYRNATLEDGLPINGIVKVLVASAPFVVEKAVARKEGLEIE